MDLHKETSGANVKKRELLHYEQREYVMKLLNLKDNQKNKLKKLLTAIISLLVIVSIGIITTSPINITKAKFQNKLILYLPDTLPDNYYIDIQKVFPNTLINTFAVHNPKKTYEEFKKKLRYIESSNSYSSRRTNSNGSLSQYLGAYQIGSQMRTIIGLGDISDSLFLCTPSIQDAAMDLCIIYNRNLLRPYLEQYEGTFIAGYQMTESNMLAIAHNAGPYGLINFLISYGVNLPRDSNGISYEFMKLSGYKITPHGNNNKSSTATRR